jgi:hypothetical protein
MTNQEFSDSFDTILNSHFSGAPAMQGDIALDEYEKSVFLTKAQDELVIGLYSGRNDTGASFEETEELRRYLANLVKEDTLSPIENTAGSPLGMEGSNHQFFTLPSDLWFITYESVNTSGEKACDNKTGMEVIPVTQDEYHTIKKNPFRGANNRRALRMDLGDGVIEIICKYSISSYYLRYLKEPRPIILVDVLPDGMQIKNKSEYSECELHEALHQRILDRAVMLALQSRSIGRKAD